MPFIAETGLPLLVHAELAGPCEAAADALDGADWKQYGTYLASRPEEAELQAIELMIGLCREFGCRVHIVHLASAKALPMLRAAKADGLKITVETCPHYLYFAAEEIAGGNTLLKCAPPIRCKQNQVELWGGLLDGTIDLIASDHSPCPPAMKSGDFDKAWGGIASISLGLPVVWTAAASRHVSLSEVARLMSTAPATLAGVAQSKGRIAVGCDADLVVFSPEEAFTVTHSSLYFRHKISPYVGEPLQGKVRSTYLRGRCIFEQGTFPGEASGREVHA
jgi:allantoinase